MKQVLIIFTVLLIGQQAFGQLQNDPEAQRILDKTADLAKSFADISLKFNYEFYSVVDETTLNQSGEVILKGDKYKLVLEESEIYYDGTSIYNYIVDANEVTISETEQDYDEFFLSNPSRIFVMYRDDFKYAYKGEELINGETCYNVVLYPNNKERDYSMITLWVLKNDYQIRKIFLKGKLGDRNTVTFEPYKTNKGYADSDFNFDVTKYKNIYVNDTRGVE